MKEQPQRLPVDYESYGDRRQMCPLPRNRARHS